MLIQYKTPHFVLKYKNKVESDLAKECGFIFDPLTKQYFTKNVKAAVRLRDYFDESAKNYIKLVSIKRTPWQGRIPLPNNKTLMPVQVESVKFAMERNHSYLALEQRIGKTPTAIAIMNIIDEETFYTSKTLIIVPPFLVSNWVREIDSWGKVKQKISTITTRKDLPYIKFKGFDILIVPDSLVIDKDILDYIKTFTFDLLIIDEAHRFNNLESKRTQNVYGSNGAVKSANKVVLLSGTPMRNRPFDLWPALSNLAHNLISYRSENSYAFKYCGGRIKEKVFFKYRKRHVRRSVEALGSSNEYELNRQLNYFMKVEKFKDHFTVNEQESLVTLDGNVSKRIQELEKAILNDVELSELVGSANLGGIATLRREMSDAKLPVAKEYIHNALNSTDDKFLVFGFHIGLLEKLYEHFKPLGAFLINGKTPIKDRTQIQKDFSEGKTRIGFANIFTMQGIDLSAANRNIFVESSWGPSDNDQAKFRVYGRNQKKNVYTEHLVLANTLDEYVMQKVLDKKETINKIIRKEVLK